MKLNNLLILALCVSTTVSAENLTCPATVKAGTALTVDALVINDDCNNPLNIQNTVVSLTGNSGGFVTGGIGLLGPYVTPYTVSIPPATCYPSVVKSYHEISNLQITNKVPLAMAGTLIAASVAILDETNHLKVIGVCPVTVTK